MALYKLIIDVKFKPGVLDPQGETIKNALLNLNYSGVQSVQTGKVFRLKVEAGSSQKAVGLAREMADKLLANPVIEEFAVEIEK